jgi:hypothetical protein
MNQFASVQQHNFGSAFFGKAHGIIQSFVSGKRKISGDKDAFHDQFYL